MKMEFGSKGEDCFAFIGACISYNHFEVGEEVAEKFPAAYKRFDTERKKYFVDLKSANQSQLLDFGIKNENIEISEYCTIGNNDKFFSYRKEKGFTGRMIAVIGLKPE